MIWHNRMDNTCLHEHKLFKIKKKRSFYIFTNNWFIIIFLNSLWCRYSWVEDIAVVLAASSLFLECIRHTSLSSNRWIKYDNFARNNKVGRFDTPHRFLRFKFQEKKWIEPRISQSPVTGINHRVIVSNTCSCIVLLTLCLWSCWLIFVEW